MSFDYAEIAIVARELIAEFGGPGVHKRIVPGGDYDPETGTTTPDAEISQDVLAVVLPIRQGLIDGETVLRTDEMAYLSAVNLTAPKATDVLTWQGKSYTIMDVVDLAPAGMSVLVKMIVRR